MLENDTIHSIAIRNNCSVSDIKRLNKIQQDNEIYAFKKLKVPLNPLNVLVDTLPKVHKSGNSSPNKNLPISSSTIESKETLEEKLLLASVSNAVIKTSDNDESSSNEPTAESGPSEPLIQPSKQFRGYPKSIKLPKNDFLSINGSDCEISWVILLVVILAFCVIIPLIYVYAVYEHPERFNHSHSRYDDPDLRYRVHIDDDKMNDSSHH